MMGVQYANVVSYRQPPTDWECPICLEKKDEGLIGHQGENSSTFHLYHKSCLKKWLEEKPSCPECRAALRTEDLGAQEIFLINVEFALPRLTYIPANYMQEVSENLPATATLSAGFVLGEFLTHGTAPLNSISLCVGSGIGFFTSRVVRHHLRDRVPARFESEIQRIQFIVQSKPFVGAMAVTATLGLASFFGTALVSTLPFVLGGMAVHYGIERCAESGFISEGKKTTLQKVAATLSMAYGMTSPFRYLTSMGVGSLIGAVIEHEFASADRGEEETGL